MQPVGGRPSRCLRPMLPVACHACSCRCGLCHACLAYHASVDLCCAGTASAGAMPSQASTQPAMDDDVPNESCVPRLRLYRGPNMLRVSIACKARFKFARLQRLQQPFSCTPHRSRHKCTVLADTRLHTAPLVPFLQDANTGGPQRQRGRRPRSACCSGACLLCSVANLPCARAASPLVRSCNLFLLCSTSPLMFVSWHNTYLSQRVACDNDISLTRSFLRRATTPRLRQTTTMVSLTTRR